ncbi:GNAT family N-acetyltransferase [Caballeronia insecticola]|uniref:BioF2-like acetyltransferase domain-containing protein n=1 Tax=Caballeronia insecticola TaxID=758793 RepID=R4X3W8_9BURK|nr:GNAT family N-acetyltransferase [Caballeronia insecticola]BAN26782.1 putative uncharacterized protein [Caballeronia insecticola]
MPPSDRHVQDPQDPQFHVSIVCDPEAFLALRDEWNALWSSVDGQHNQSFAVCWLCWLYVAKPRGRRLHCIVVREHGELKLVWPLVSHRRHLWTMLEPLAPGTAEHTSILVSADAEHAIDAAWQSAIGQCGADVLSIPYVSADSRIDRLASKHPGLAVTTLDVSATALLRREPEWNAYRDSLSSLSKKKPAAIERRFMKEGVLEIRVIDAADTGAHARWVDWMLARKREWAERVGKHGPWLDSHDYRDFLIRLLDGTRDEPLALMFLMTLDGAPVVVNVVGLGSTSASGLIAGFDPAYAKFSPGAIMMERCVKWAWEHRLDLDFGIGKEEFKAYWSRGNILPNKSFQIALSRWGRFAFLAKAVAAKLAGLRAKKTRADAGKPGKRPVG